MAPRTPWSPLRFWAVANESLASESKAALRVTTALYVAPAPALATDAVLPVEPDVTLPGAVIVAFGLGLMITAVAADGALVQPLVVTITV